MSCFTISRSIAKYVLLSLLCYDFTFSAPTESVQDLEDDKEEHIYGYDEEENEIFHDDFFRFTTRKKYIWEDWTVPTRDYGDYGTSSGSSDFLLYVIIPVLVVVFIITFAYLCIRGMQNENCCSFESDSHSPITSDLFTTLHRPPERRRDLTAQVHRPPTSRNNYWDLRSELLDEPARPNLFNEQISNHIVADTTGATISFINPTSASSSQSRREVNNTATEKPPDYSTVTLNDLVNPTKPAFPVVKNGNETPPPEYGKENSFFK